MNRQKNIWNFLIGSFVMFSVVACSTPEKQELGKYEFHYFPNVNMYYDVAAGQYIYSLDSARTWNIVNENTAEPPVILGESHVLYSDNKQVWELNEQHREQFKGTVFDIVKPGGMIAAAEYEVKERKVKQPVVKKEAVKEEKKKKGLGKFFSNLFGKKKRTQENNE